MQRFERKAESLASRRVFIRRVILYAVFSTGIIGSSLVVGVLGYHFTEGMSWIDSLLNAAMILGGMGPVDPLRSVAGKLFASFYALFAGIVFLVAVGVLIAPVFHRFMHSFHVAPEDVSQAEAKKNQRQSSARRRR